MALPSRQRMLGPWRRGLFWSWVAGSALVAIYIGIAGPVVRLMEGVTPVIAWALPALMVFMLLTGIGWLVLLVAAPRGKGRPEAEGRK